MEVDVTDESSTPLPPATDKPRVNRRRHGSPGLGGPGRKPRACKCHRCGSSERAIH